MSPLFFPLFFPGNVNCSRRGETRCLHGFGGSSGRGIGARLSIRSLVCQANTAKKNPCHVAQKLHLKFAPCAGSMLMRTGSEGRVDRGERGMERGGENWRNGPVADQHQRHPGVSEGRPRQRREFCNRPPQWPMRRRRRRRRVVASLCSPSRSDCSKPTQQDRRWKERCKTWGATIAISATLGEDALKHARQSAIHKSTHTR